MCLGFVSIAMNLCFAGLKIIVGYLKKTNKQTTLLRELFLLWRVLASWISMLPTSTFWKTPFTKLKTTLYSLTAAIGYCWQICLKQIWKEYSKFIQFTQELLHCLHTCIRTYREYILSNPTELKESGKYVVWIKFLL